jgi:hypothetical protein
VNTWHHQKVTFITTYQITRSEYCKWKINPPVQSESENIKPSLIDKKIEISNELTSRLKHSENFIQFFPILVNEEYANTEVRTLGVLIQYFTSYLCQLVIYAPVGFETK